MLDLRNRLITPWALLAVLAFASGAARADGAKAADPAKAEITVLAPADAEVFFDGAATTQTGGERLFLCPALPIGKKYHYDVLARWRQGGKTVEQTRRVEVTSGAKVRVDFRTARVETPSKGKGVAQSVGPKGRLLRRQDDAKNPWKVVGDQEELPAEDLLIGLPGAEVENASGSVRLRLLKYFDSPLPVMEPAVTLHANADFDVDFTLERGMVELWNSKKKGGVRVQIRARGQTWRATLEEPGSRLFVELYSGWLQGAPFKKKPGPKDAPLARLTFLVLKGDVDLEYSGAQWAMSAPPGLAFIEWDSVTGMDAAPQQLKALPAWVLPPQDEAGKARAKKIAEALERFAAEAAKTGSLDAPIQAFLASDDPFDRRLAVVALAATDQLHRLGEVLKTAQADRRDVWEDAVLALRHWIGRAPGQDQILYQKLIDAKSFTPKEAETALELLHDFGPDDLTRPVVYQLLIHFLDSDKAFIRGLAYWHLSRLVPEGKKFGYDPFGPEAARAAAVKKWRQWIPNGKLPPAPKEAGK